MLLLIHGDDTATSRKFFIDTKKRISSPVTFDPAVMTLTDVIQTLSAGGLFGDEKHIFIESLLTKKKKSPELASILDAFAAHPESNIYLWEGKEIDKRTVTSLKHSREQLFKLPQSLFQFLDALAPANTRQLQLFHETVASVEVEMVFFMLIRQIRILLAVSDPGSESIDEVKRLAPWQRTKLEKQAKLFPLEQLRVHYRRLYDIDLAQKTGKLPSDLTSAIDIWLLEL